MKELEEEEKIRKKGGRGRIRMRRKKITDKEGTGRRRKE